MADPKRRALHSIVFHAWFGDDPDWPAELRPLPLAEALGILAGGGEDSASERWWASSYLLASERRDVADMLDPLNLAILDLHPGLADTLGKAGSFKGMKPAAAGGVGGITHARTFAFLSTTSGPPPGACQRTPPETSIDFDSKTELITGHSTLRVRRPLADVARTLDPQNWSVVIPDYFRASYVADCPANQCTPDPNYDLPPKLPPPTAGMAWMESFFENYELDIGHGMNLVSFKNALDIQSSPAVSGTSHRFDYSLKKVLYGKVGALEQVGGGLDRDDGFIQLADVGGGWVEVSGTKNFRLSGWDGVLAPGTNSLLNWWTSVTIGTTLDSVYDAVCTVV